MQYSANWTGSPEEQWNKEIIYGMFDNPNYDPANRARGVDYINAQHLDPQLFDKNPGLFYHFYDPERNNKKKGSKRDNYFPYSLTKNDIMEGEDFSKKGGNPFVPATTLDNVVGAEDTVFVPFQDFNNITPRSFLRVLAPDMFQHEAEHIEDKKIMPGSLDERAKKVIDMFGGFKEWRSFLENMVHSDIETSEIENLYPTHKTYIKDVSEGTFKYDKHPFEYLADFGALQYRLKNEGKNLFNMGEKFDSQVFKNPQHKAALQKVLQYFGDK